MPRLKKGKGKKKERYGKSKFYHQRRSNKRNKRALNSWKKNFPEYFHFDPDRYPFYFLKSKQKQKKQQLVALET